MNVDTEEAVPATGELPPSSPMTIESSPSPKRKDTTKESDEESNSSLNEHLRYYGYPTRKSVRTAKAKVISLPPGASVPTVLELVGDSRDPSQQRYSETDTVSLASDTKWAKAGPATLVGASASSAASSKPSSRPGKRVSWKVLSNDGSMGVVAETGPCPPDQPLTHSELARSGLVVQPEDPKPTRNAIFNMYTADHPIQGVGVVKVPYPLFHMEFSDAVEHGTSERERAQGPPTVGMVKKNTLQEGSFVLG